MTWLEFTNPGAKSCTHEWARVFDVKAGGAIETEWLNPSTGAAIAVLSARDLFSFCVAYGAPGTVDVIDITERVNAGATRFEPRDISDRVRVRDNVRTVVRGWLSKDGGVLAVSGAAEHEWTLSVTLPPRTDTL
jgi:hypothetical protein